MRREAARAFALVALLAPLAARADEAPCAACTYRGDLEALFVPARSLGDGWETLGESPVDPQEDPDLREAGVRAARSLHYTHAIPGGAEVCSVEIWSFGSAEEARRARAGMERERWRFSLQGNLLVMLRGVTLQRDRGLRPGLLPACHRLADLTEARARSLLRPAGR